MIIFQQGLSTQSPPQSNTINGTRFSGAKSNTYHTLREQVPRKSPAFLGRTSSWSSIPNSAFPRSISLGSIDELRCNSFVSTKQRVFSVPTMPSYPSSLAASIPSTPRTSLRTLSVCDFDDLASLNQLRRDPMFVGIHGAQQVDFIFPASSDLQNSSVSPSRPSLLGSKAHSHHSSRQNDSTPLLVRSSHIQSGLEETRGTAKIPLFVPSQIIKPDAGRLLASERQTSRPSSNAALKVGDSVQNKPSQRQENHSKEALSEESDWSTTVQFEAPKPEVFQSKFEGSAAPDPRLSTMQEVQPAGRRSREAPRHFQVEFLPSGLDGAESLKSGHSAVSHANHRGKRPFQVCAVYFKRMKQRLWRSSWPTVNTV